MVFNPIPFSGYMSGFKGYQKTLQEKGLLATNNVDRELGNLALRVEAKAKELAPVKTGRLRASIGIDHVRKFYWLVGTNVVYAPYQEFGSGRNKPHPYIRPALQTVQADLRRILGRAKLLR